jgi:hypothetical protein
VSESVPLLGLYRVLIEASDQSGPDLRANVARRLHENRSLCEDFAEITVLEPQLVAIDAILEIGHVEDPDQFAGEVIQAIADVISPSVRFSTLSEMLRAGFPVEAILQGPRLQHGFISDDALASATKPTAIHASDIVHALMDVTGVRAVGRLVISSGDKSDAWSLAVEPEHVPMLDRNRLNITFRRDGKSVLIPNLASPRAATPVPARNAVDDLSPPPGQNRNVGTYLSVQHHLPALYGVGDTGLPGSASPERKAQAKQLQAYLMFFDQLMANYLAQLANVKHLLSYDSSEIRTYFAQAVHEPGSEADEIVASHNEQQLLWSSLGAMPTDGDTPPVDGARKNRFLNHLLARFADAIESHDTTSGALIERKQTFLRQFPWLSSARGTGFNVLAPGGVSNRSALEDRLRLKLGLVEEDGETFILVEHILLRPIPGDERQEVPLLANPVSRDPYSLQLTFVLPEGPGRFADASFQQLVETTIRDETPAHLTSFARWLPTATFRTFQAAYGEWLDRLRAYLAEKLGVQLKEAVS